MNIKVIRQNSEQQLLKGGNEMGKILTGKDKKGTSTV